MSDNPSLEIELDDNIYRVKIDDQGSNSTFLRNLQVDHGSLTQIRDTVFIFTPEVSYSGPVKFSYDLVCGLLTTPSSFDFAPGGIHSAVTVDPVITTDTSPVITGSASLDTGDTLFLEIEDARYNVTPDIDGHWRLDLGSATPVSGKLEKLQLGKRYDIHIKIVNGGLTVYESETHHALTLSSGGAYVDDGEELELSDIEDSLEADDDLDIREGGHLHGAQDMIYSGHSANRIRIKGNLDIAGSSDDDNGLKLEDGDDSLEVSGSLSADHVDTGADDDHVTIGKAAMIAVRTFHLGSGNNKMLVNQSNLADITSASGDKEATSIDIKGDNDGEIDTTDGGTARHGKSSISIKGHSSADIHSGDGDDKVSVGGDAEDLDLGDGKNSLSIGGHAHDIRADGDLTHGNSIKVKGGIHDLDLSSSEGNDTVSIGDDANDLDLGDGKNSLSLGGDLLGDLDGGDGNDHFVIKGSLIGDGSSSIDLGAAKNELLVTGSVDHYEIRGGTAREEISIKGDLLHSTILLGGGSDSLSVKGQTVDLKLDSQGSIAKINLGSLNDSLSLLSNFSGSLKTGSGDDILNLGAFSLSGKIDLGKGIDTVVIDGAADIAVLAATVSNLEIVDIGSVAELSGLLASDLFKLAGRDKLLSLHADAGTTLNLGTLGGTSLSVLSFSGTVGAFADLTHVNGASGDAATLTLISAAGSLNIDLSFA